MGRISDDLLQCVCYVYPSAEAAQQRAPEGGTGFFIGVPVAEDESVLHCYAVTAAHVVRGTASPVLTVNLVDGGFDTIVTDRDSWVAHPDGDDLAVRYTEILPTHRAKVVPQHMFLTEELCELVDLGPGDDTFMVGRFKYAEGVDVVQPSARFGNVATMPHGIVNGFIGIRQLSFLVEVRSLSGFSGSPVFVQMVPPASRASLSLNPWERRILERAGFGPYLLGVDWGHLHDQAPLLDAQHEPAGTGEHVEVNSGMMCVVPAWKLIELLNTKALVVQRDTERRRWLEENS